MSGAGGLVRARGAGGGRADVAQDLADIVGLGVRLDALDVVVAGQLDQHLARPRLVPHEGWGVVAVGLLVIGGAVLLRFAFALCDGGRVLLGLRLLFLGGVPGRELQAVLAVRDLLEQQLAHHRHHLGGGVPLVQVHRLSGVAGRDERAQQAVGVDLDEDLEQQFGRGFGAFILRDAAKGDVQEARHATGFHAGSSTTQDAHQTIDRTVDLFDGHGLEDRSQGADRALGDSGVNVGFQFLAVDQVREDRAGLGVTRAGTSHGAADHVPVGGDERDAQRLERVVGTRLGAIDDVDVRAGVVTPDAVDRQHADLVPSFADAQLVRRDLTVAHQKLHVGLVERNVLAHDTTQDGLGPLHVLALAPLDQATHLRVPLGLEAEHRTTIEVVGDLLGHQFGLRSLGVSLGILRQTTLDVLVPERDLLRVTQREGHEAVLGASLVATTLGGELVGPDVEVVQEQAHADVATAELLRAVDHVDVAVGDVPAVAIERDQGPGVLHHYQSRGPVRVREHGVTEDLDVALAHPLHDRLVTVHHDGAVGLGFGLKEVTRVGRLRGRREGVDRRQHRGVLVAGIAHDGQLDLVDPRGHGTLVALVVDRRQHVGQKLDDAVGHEPGLATVAEPDERALLACGGCVGIGHGGLLTLGVGGLFSKGCRHVFSVSLQVRLIKPMERAVLKLFGRFARRGE